MGDQNELPKNVKHQLHIKDNNSGNEATIIEFDMDPDHIAGQDHIYAVCSFNLDPKRFRTIGFFTEKEVANRCVLEDWGHLNEAGYYNWACVEKIPSGLYPIIRTEESLFYKYNYDEDRWERSEAPDFEYDRCGMSGIG